MTCSSIRVSNGVLRANNYSPYNIRKAGKDKYEEVAVAGFNKDDVSEYKTP